MPIRYRSDIAPEVQQIIDVYNSSGIQRPTGDPERISTMFQHANLVVSAWDGELLVGIARSLTDFSYCCYLSDLAVRKEYQQQGIGRALIAQTREKIGKQSMLLLVAAPDAADYYPKLQMEKVERAFIFKRES